MSSAVAAESVFGVSASSYPDQHLRIFKVAKRTFDVFGVIAVAPVAMLLVALACLAILARSGKPVFFIQSRVGLGGRVFPMLKLRTMEGLESSEAAATATGDPRIKSLGRFLRRYRIDELPQLLNVLKGDMSLIGPRPEQPELVERYRSLIADYDDRHMVRPGITGWAQVMYGYASTVEETRIKLHYDQDYVKRASALLDAEIIARTFYTIVFGRGAR